MSSPKYQKIAIWGSVAMGKTTLTKLLGSKIRITNLIFTDNIMFTDELSKKKRSHIFQHINKLLQEPKWIIDGNLGELIPRIEIMKSADLIVILNLPFYRSIKRMIIRDVRLIFNLNKHREFHNLRKSWNFIVNLIALLFESVSIIKNYKFFFYFNLLSLVRKYKLDQKVVIICSDSDLDKLLKNL